MINKHAWLLSDLEKIPKNGLKVFSTFACGGGSTMGYKLTGCEVIGANDIDPEMAYHYKLNHNPKYYFLCPIKDLLKIELPSELFGIDILDGSPPCSSFSMAGSWEKDWGKEKHFREGQAKQVLDDLFFDYLNLVERLNPKVAIAENVKGMIQGNAKWYVKQVFDKFKEIGYRPQLFLVNAADCGVPQKRERVFFCALRNDIDRPKLVLAPKQRWIGTKESLNDLRSEWDGWRIITPMNKRYILNDKRPHHPVNEPYPTLTGTILPENLFNPISKKFAEFSFVEYKRIGSFPDDYQAKTDKVGKYMIGMSVPPRMMEQVAKAVIEQWLT